MLHLIVILYALRYLYNQIYVVLCVENKFIIYHNRKPVSRVRSLYLIIRQSENQRSFLQGFVGGRAGLGDTVTIKIKIGTGEIKQSTKAQMTAIRDERGSIFLLRGGA